MLRQNQRAAAFGVALAALAGGLPAAALAEPAASPGDQVMRVDLQGGAARQRLSLPRGKSAIIELPVDARDVLVTNPAVADVVLRTPRRLYVLGVAAGMSMTAAMMARPWVTVLLGTPPIAWLVGGRLVRWSFSMEPVDEGTRLTESWEFLPDGIAFFHERYGDAAEEQIADRTRAAHEGIPQTLDAIRRIAEAG